MFRFFWTLENKSAPKTYENFGLGGSGKTFFYIDPALLKELQKTSERVGISFEKALRGVGYELHQMAKKGISTQGRSVGYAWGRKKSIKRRERYWYFAKGANGGEMRSGKPLSKVRSCYKSEKSLETGQLFGGVRPALRYRQEGLKVTMGAASKSAAAYFAAVQGGMRGNKYRFQYRNNQPITPKMRRLFFAMGIPLPKEKRTLQQAKRPLIYPVYRKAFPHFREMIVKRMQHELDRKNQKAAQRK